MCTNRRWVYNKYIKEKVLVDCGHCPACWQKRANQRANLIQLHSANSGKVCIFTTLTYDKDSLPYIDYYGLRNYLLCTSNHSIGISPINTVPIYRDFRLRHSRNKNKRDYSKRIILTRKSSDMSEYLDFVQFDNNLRCKDGHLPFAQKSPGRIGVLFYKDVQDFQKRLKINVTRKLHKADSLEFFCTGEYGPDTLRPHFHVLIWCEVHDVGTVLRSIPSSWPYGSKRRTRKYTEIARDASKYVNKYLNGHTFVPPYLQKYFPPKSSKSVFFGYTKNAFNAEVLQDMYGRRDFTKNYADGIGSSTNIPSAVPLSPNVISRYFPKFVGFSRLTDSAIIRIINRPKWYVSFASVFNQTKSDITNYLRRLQKAFFRFSEDFGIKDISIYADYFVKYWRAFKSWVFKVNLQRNEEKQVPLIWQFDNINDVFRFPSKFPFYPLKLSCMIDVNVNPYQKFYSNKLSDYFQQRLKLDEFNSSAYYSNDEWAGL